MWWFSPSSNGRTVAVNRHDRVKDCGTPFAFTIAAMVFAACAAGCGEKSCTFDGVIYSSGSTWQCDCNVCGCDNGTVSSTGAICSGVVSLESQDASDAQGGSSDASEPGEGSIGDAAIDAPQGD